MMTRMITRLAAAVFLATAVSGGTIAATTKSSPIAQAAQTIKLNEKQALAKFKQKYAKAKISEISLEKHHNRYQYEIKLNQVISRQKANQLAEKAAKSGQGREWTLETDHGQTIWQVDVVDGHQKTEVKINAVNKKVISVETDD